MGLINQTQEEYYLGPDGIWNSNDENYGDYQFVSIQDIINNFVIMYVGADKLISKVKRTDIAYWAQQAIQEFSFDVLPQDKSIEVEVPPGLYTILPQDYVNYTKLSWTDERGIERIVYRTDLSSNPTPYIQDSEYEYTFDNTGDIPLANESTTLERWNANSRSPMLGATGNWNYFLENPDLMALYAYGGRYGIQPERAQANGTFYIDHTKGMIRWSSNLRGRLVVIKYISDGLGKEGEMNVHKFAYDAIMKFIAYSILSTRANTQEYLVARFKKDMFAAKRNAKIRLSELKNDLIVQVMRNQSKWIKS
jgi:hypothetical protein|tara:strand:- start:304 stop:1227 length:924 start_codon:yes stop_codon:yes gene_type:complete